MIRNRKFKFKNLHDSGSWQTFADIYKYVTESKKKIEETFSQAVFDKNFNEPMNVLTLECDRRHPEASKIQTYANKLNEFFADNSDKIIIETRICEIPARYRSRVYFNHDWTVKETI